MTSEQLDLKKALDDYFNRFCAETTFFDRLGRENGWDRNFTQRVLEEYKKFLFIAKEGGHGVTPSPKIDKAWHLHLLYTDSYWNDFCAKVLKMQLHHNPATRVPALEAKFNEDFHLTLASCRKFFSTVPMDIWRQEMKINRPAPIATLVVVGIFFSIVGSVLGCSILPKNSDPILFAMVIGGWMVVTGLVVTILVMNRNKMGGQGNGSSCGGTTCGTGSSDGGGHSGGHGGGHGCGGGSHGCGGGSSCGGGSCGGGGH